MKTKKIQRERRINNPEGVRQRIIETAFHAFTGEGYSASPVQDLKSRAGVSGGAFSHHFPTKKALALAVIENSVSEAVESYWIKPILDAASTAEGVKCVFAQIADELDRRGRVMGCPLNNLVLELSSLDPEFREALDVIFSRWRKAIAAKLRADIEAGRLAGLDADETALFIVAAYSGAMAMAKSGQTSLPLKLCAGQLLKFLEFYTQQHERPESQITT